ncbi:MAG: tRNA (5-methylaminomethyl-2-thiouridine)(34)-methyltransferase MnmD, partial [Alphaproteobacteria bacterium]|nr:tRNA (5-methylaminomethyl-2-thiouridine)(34)-methyltransferase MnmD [Alphaproteobacteria bacterium]
MRLRPPGPSDIAFDESGTPVSARFGDVYFSREGGVAETRHVFLEGCDLPAALAGRARFAIGETGFGTGLNLLVTALTWREATEEGWLDYVSTELYPLTRDKLCEALGRLSAREPALAPAAAELIDAWPAPCAGFHRIELGSLRTRLTLLVGDAAEMLGALEARIDAWFLDGFSPARNPEMWSPALFRETARLSAPGARLATYTVAARVRTGLAEAGFALTRRPGFGRKR